MYSPRRGGSADPALKQDRWLREEKICRYCYRRSGWRGLAAPPSSSVCRGNSRLQQNRFSQHPPRTRRVHPDFSLISLKSSPAKCWLSNLVSRFNIAPNKDERGQNRQSYEPALDPEEQPEKAGVVGHAVEIDGAPIRKVLLDDGSQLEIDIPIAQCIDESDD
jgi:hypothetical protein